MKTRFSNPDDPLAHLEKRVAETSEVEA